MTARNKLTVENTGIFQEYCIDRDLSSSSIRLYRLALDKYINFVGMNLEDLINEADEDQDKGLKTKKRRVTKYLRDFKIDLRLNNHSVNYTSQIMTMVRAFYYEHDIELPRQRRKTRKDRVPETFDDLPTMDEIRTIMGYANNTYRAIITVGLSSGMGGAEILSLTFRHYYDALGLTNYPQTMKELINIIADIDKPVLKWQINRVKTGKSYFTFTSPEASELIKNYLQELYRSHLDYDPKPEDQFFRNNNVPIGGQALRSMFRRYHDKSGNRTVNKTIIVRPHRLRKYFATTLEKNKMQHTATRYMMGHTIEKTTEAYFKADPKSIKDDYLEIVHQLMTDDTGKRLAEDPEKILAEIDDIKKRLLSRPLKIKNKVDF